MRSQLVTLLVLVVSVAFPWTVSAGEPIAITVDPSAVTLQGATPGAHVVVFGVAREPHESYSEIRRWTEVLEDDDHDGVVRLSSVISSKSIWIAVELESGRYVAGTGAEYPRREIAAGDVFKRNNAGQLSKFENARGQVEMLIVRPGKGAWRAGASKDSSLDENKGTPSALKLDISSFTAVTGLDSIALPHLKRDDVVAMIDPNRMEFYVTVVGEE